MDEKNNGNETKDVDKDKSRNDGDNWAKKVIDHISLAHVHVREHGIEVFYEALKENPKRAIKELPDFIDRTLNLGKGMFRGYMCGGPCEYVTAPFLAAVGTIYPLINQELREIALHNCLSFLDGQNYFLAQDNVQYIDDPWLVADILINRSLYWCGFKEYANKLEEIATWEEFEQEFIKEGEEASYLSARSMFWLAYTVARIKYSSEPVRRTFSELFPELIDHTKDAIAALIVDHSKAQEVREEYPIPFEEGVENRLKKYDPSWEDDLRKKMEEEKWIWLPRAREELGLDKE